jgi:hypothetical protein
MQKTNHYAFCCDLTGVQVTRCVHIPDPLNPAGVGTDTDTVIWTGKIAIRDISSKNMEVTIHNKQLLLTQIAYFDRSLVEVIQHGDIINFNYMQFQNNTDFDPTNKGIEKHYIQKLVRPSNRTRIGRLEAYTTSSN